MRYLEFHRHPEQLVEGSGATSTGSGSHISELADYRVASVDGGSIVLSDKKW